MWTQNDDELDRYLTIGCEELWVMLRLQLCVEIRLDMLYIVQIRFNDVILFRLLHGIDFITLFKVGKNWGQNISYQSS